LSGQLFCPQSYEEVSLHRTFRQHLHYLFADTFIQSSTSRYTFKVFPLIQTHDPGKHHGLPIEIYEHLART